MGWGKFDDRYPSNRKVRPLSDAAFRLDVSAILWCNSQLTDGRIETDELPLVSDVKHPAKAAAELVRRGRWHLAGEGCGTDECPKGEPGEGWQIHDHLEFNESKAAVLARREADRNRKKRSPKGSTPPQPPAGFQPESERSPNGIQSASGVDSARIPSDPSRMPAGARAQARAPSRPVLKEPLQDGSGALDPNAHEHAAAALAPLRAALEDVRLVVRWDKLTPEQATRIGQLADVHGVPRLVAAAQRAWQRDNPPAFAQAWLGAWGDLPEPRRLRAVGDVCADHALPAPCISCAADRKAAL